MHRLLVPAMALVVGACAAPSTPRAATPSERPAVVEATQTERMPPRQTRAEPPVEPLPRIDGFPEPIATPRPADPVPPPPSSASPSGDLDQQVRECAIRGDNPCIIRLLEGRAETESQLAQLIEAYRARREMQEFRPRSTGSGPDAPGGTDILLEREIERSEEWAEPLTPR